MVAINRGYTTDPVLTAHVQAFRNPRYIFEQVFPVVTVEAQAATFHAWLKGAWFRDEAQPRPPGAMAARGDVRKEARTYNCTNKAFGHAVPDEIRRRDGDAMSELIASQHVANAVMLNKERQVAAEVLTAANWTSSEDVAGGWASDASPSTFFIDVETAMDTIELRCGYRPNVLMVDSQTLFHLRQTPAIYDRIQFATVTNQPRLVTPMLLAASLGLDEVVVGGSIHSTAAEKADGTDFTAARIWQLNAGKGSAFLFYRSPSPNLEMPSAGYLLQYEQVDAYQYREDSRHQDVVEASANYNAYPLAADMGHLFTDTILT